jgi:hypothetical protein
MFCSWYIYIIIYYYYIYNYIYIYLFIYLLICFGICTLTWLWVRFCVYVGKGISFLCPHGWYCHRVVVKRGTVESGGWSMHGCACWFGGGMAAWRFGTTIHSARSIAWLGFHHGAWLTSSQAQGSFHWELEAETCGCFWKGEGQVPRKTNFEYVSILYNILPRHVVKPSENQAWAYLLGVIVNFPAEDENCYWNILYPGILLADARPMGSRGNGTVASL